MFLYVENFLQKSSKGFYWLSSRYFSLRQNKEITFCEDGNWLLHRGNSLTRLYRYVNFPTDMQPLEIPLVVAFVTFFLDLRREMWKKFALERTRMSF